MNEDRIKEDLRRKREALLAAQAAASGERPPAGQERQRPAPLTAEEARQFGIVEATHSRGGGAPAHAWSPRR